MLCVYQMLECRYIYKYKSTILTITFFPLHHLCGVRQWHTTPKLNISQAANEYFARTRKQSRHKLNIAKNFGKPFKNVKSTFTRTNPLTTTAWGHAGCGLRVVVGLFVAIDWRRTVLVLLDRKQGGRATVQRGRVQVWRAGGRGEGGGGAVQEGWWRGAVQEVRMVVPCTLPWGRWRDAGRWWNIGRRWGAKVGCRVGWGGEGGGRDRQHTGSGEAWWGGDKAKVLGFFSHRLVAENVLFLLLYHP